MISSVLRLVTGCIVLLSVFTVTGPSASVAQAKTTILYGGGASFPAPLYVKWFKDYSRKHPDVVFSYKSMGSGQGVFGFAEKRLAFAGTDVPMSPEEIAKVDDGVVQVPLTAGAVVLIFNLEDIKNLRLSREAYSGIFLGKVKNWKDPLIAKENPGIQLPETEIVLVARAESSGTTHVLTRHLNAVDETFAKMVGTAKQPVWPQVLRDEGRLVKTVGNGGVAQMVKVLPGSIGYVEYSYAYFSNIAMATLQNKAGEFIFPTPHSFLTALNSAAPFMDTLVSPMPPDADGDDAYPIMSLSWIVFNETYEDPALLKAIQNVFDYALSEGQQYNTKLGYIPLAEPLLSKAREAVRAIRLKK